MGFGTEKKREQDEERKEQNYLRGEGEEQEREEERRGNEEEPVGGGGPEPKISLGAGSVFCDTIAGVDLVWGGGAPHTNQETTLF